MKTLAKLIVVLSAMATPVVPSVAQITISETNFSNILTVGNSAINKNDTLATSFNVGTPGGPNTWNFSGLAAHTSQTPVSVALSSIPTVIRNNFPTATHAFRLDSLFDLGGGIRVNAKIYQFLQLSATGLRNIGAMAREMVQVLPPPLPPVEGILRVTVNPVEIVYALPMTRGTTWNTAFSNNVRIILNGQDLSNTTTNHNATYTVDGYGTMRIPTSSNPIYALRLRKLNFYNGNPVVSFIFISRGGALVQCEATDTSARSGTIAVRRKTVIWNPSIVSDSTTSVLSERVPSEYALKQNFPNPFNPSTTINYHVASTGVVTLGVYNVLGEQVSMLVNDVKTPGVYEVNWDGDALPSGVYFYRMHSGAFTETRRMLLLK